MTASKFGEPWTYHKDADGERIKDSRGRTLLFSGADTNMNDVVWSDFPLGQVVADHNACATLPNPSALPALLEALKNMNRSDYGGTYNDFEDSIIDVLWAFRALCGSHAGCDENALRAVKPQQQEESNRVFNMPIQTDDRIPHDCFALDDKLYRIGDPNPIGTWPPAERGEAE